MSQHPGLDELDARRTVTAHLDDLLYDLDAPVSWPVAERLADALFDRLDDAGYRVTRTRP